MYNLLLISMVSLSIGSFLNFLIYRLTSNESIFSSRSICPKCKHQLKWYHNIPLISYLFLKGKCGYCKDGISIQYPLIELFTMSLGIFIYWFKDYNLLVGDLFLFITFCLLLTLSVIDFKHKVIPEGLSIIALIFSILATTNIEDSIMFSMSTIGIVYLLKAIGESTLKREIFGEGDILIFGIASAILMDIQLIFSFLLLTSILSIIPMLYIRFKNKGDKMIYDDRFLDLIKIVNIKINSKIDDYVYKEKLNILKDGLENFRIKDNLHSIPFIPFMSIALFLTYIGLKVI